MRGLLLGIFGVVLVVVVAVVGFFAFFYPASVQRSGPAASSQAPLGVQSLASSSASPASDVPLQGIAVIGTAEVNATPDLAWITVGVQSRGSTAREAQTANNQAMSQVIANLKQAGVQDKDIQTTGVNLSAVTSQNNEITGYQTSNAVTVIVRDISQVGSLLDSAVTSGANTTTSVRFGLSKEKEIGRQALGEAFKDARANADAIASAMGVTVTGIQSVSEESVGGPRPLDRAVPMAATASSVPIQTGEMSVTAQVRVVFSY